MHNILNILNFNSDIIKDQQNADEIINLITDIKNNLSSANYLIYQKCINKISKFINMILPNLKKELKDESDSYFDFNDDNEDDNISIDSISEYEYDLDATELEELQIQDFEEQTSIKYINTFNNFDFEYEKIYI